LFTDIEGSTRLWAEGREAMHGALERHDDILRTTIEDNGGFVFATGGDAFSAAFQTTQDALAAAVEAQLVLAAEDRTEIPLRVRMGIHTGEAEERDNNYFGPAVNESARLMSAGHGGQILVSETAQRIAGDRLPDSVVLLDLGEHRLKDLVRPIRVYQVTHPELPAEFPPLGGMGTSRNNLPSQLTSFVGRDRELIELRKLLDTARLVTLTGAGGSGKTRLALEFARSELDSYPDGVWFVDLATVDDPMVVGAAVAATLGVSDRVGQKILDRLVDRLSVERTLLILDNCEHLVDAAASLTSDLLKRTDALVVLATSREPLGISGESAYPVATLADPDVARGDQGFRSEGPAVRLFVDRASLARPGIHWSQDDERVVASICRRLDGLPLALELAAARLSVLTPGELLERLDDRFALLVGGARDRLPRQQTLTATIDWSYQLLAEEEQLLFARLSIFSGGFTLDAAEDVCAGDGVASDRMLDLVSGLVDKSLVLVEHGRAGGRFGLLETMREYAATKLPAEAEDERRRAHAGYFQQLVIDSFDELWGPSEAGWLDRLEDEWPNMRRALAWHIDHITQDGLLMAGSLYRFAFRRHYRPEVLGWLERFLDADLTPGSARARALNGMGLLSGQHHYFEEAIALYREYGPTRELAVVLQNAAVTRMETGDWVSVRTMIAEAIDLYDAMDPELSGLLTLQGQIALEVDHDPQRAVEFAEKSLELAHESNSPETIITTLLYLGWFRTSAGDLEGAETALRRALELAAEMSGREPTTGAADAFLSGVALARGDVDRALLHLAQNATLSRPLFDEEDTRLDAVLWLHLWAEAAVRQRRYAIAVSLLGAQTASYEASHLVQFPTFRAEADHTLSEARASLDPESFDQAWAEGTAMSGPEAFDYAVEQLGTGAQPHS
jgi:predicted ATPase/class 3 adenylate cyclase